MEKIHYIKTFLKNLDEKSEKYISELKEYDENGNLVCLRNYDSKGDVIFEHIFNFDSNNKLISESISDFVENYYEKKDYKYDQSTSNLVEEKIDYGDAGYSIKKYFYDSNKIIIKLYDEDDEIEEETEMIFDDCGNLLIKTVKDDMNIIIEKIKNSFDTNDRLIMKEEYDRFNKVEKIHHYYYTESGKIQGIKTLNSRGKTIDWIKIDFNENDKPVLQSTMAGDKIELEYLDDNIIIEKYINQHGVEVSKNKIIRDEKGNTLEEHSVSEIKIYEYIYY